MDWLWLALPFIFLIAGGGLFLAVQRPGFWIAVVKSLVAGMLPSLKKLGKRKPPKAEAEDHARYRRGEPPNRRRPGAGGKNG